VGHGTAGGDGGTITLEATFGNMTLNGDVRASGMNAGGIIATAGNGGAGGKKGGGNGGTVLGAGKGGSAQAITITVGKTLPDPNAVIANGGNGGNQSGTPGNGGSSTTGPGGNGGNLGPAGLGGSAGEITVPPGVTTSANKGSKGIRTSQPGQ